MDLNERCRQRPRGIEVFPRGLSTKSCESALSLAFSCVATGRTLLGSLEALLR